MKITAPAKYGSSAALAAQRYRKVTIKILHAKLHVIDLYLHTYISIPESNQTEFE